MTGPQARCLEILKEFPNGLSAGQVAWNRRTRFRAVSNQGALGGTMPMKAGSLLNRMRTAGLVYRDSWGRWYA